MNPKIRAALRDLVSPVREGFGLIKDLLVQRALAALFRHEAKSLAALKRRTEARSKTFRGPSNRDKLDL
jgi:hypothetical protein